MKASELLYVFALVASALLATATNQCGGAVDAPPLEATTADASPDAAPIAPSCYAAADPFRAYACGSSGVTCACPDCYVADAGAGTCKP